MQIHVLVISVKRKSLKQIYNLFFEIKHWQDIGNYKISVRVDIVKWDILRVTLCVEFGK